MNDVARPPANQEVAALIDDLYDAVVARDRERFDRHLAADVTIWESDVADLMRGVSALAAHRNARDARQPTSTVLSLRADEQLVDVFADAAVVRYRLTARTSDRPEARFRVTDVLRHDRAGGWKIVHHHSEREPLPAPTTEPAREPTR